MRVLRGSGRTCSQAANVFEGRGGREASWTAAVLCRFRTPRTIESGRGLPQSKTLRGLGCGWAALGLCCLLLLPAGVGAPAATAEDRRSPRQDFQVEFLKFCDLAAAELNKPLTPFLSRTNADPATHHMPFFEDGHAVRALAVAYDMTDRRAYLDACCRWSDRMVQYQKGMIPAGAYYMNQARAPGQNHGQWNVADSGSIAMGVLATAVRCQDPAEKARYLASAKAFADLVLNNYLGPNGGISNGLWPQYSGEWWCSTATAGTLLFLLYEETGEERYLHAAKRALEWLVATDFRQVKPITFEQRPSGIIFYCFDLYATGLKRFPPESPAHQAILRQFDAALQWMARNQKTRGADVPDYLERNVDMAGLPCLMYSFARQVPHFKEILPAADRELQYVGRLLLAKGDPEVSRLMVWEVMTWGMLSYAEKLAPGAINRTTGHGDTGRSPRQRGGDVSSPRRAGDETSLPLFQ